MNAQKEFKIASIVLLFLGVIDVLTIALGYFGEGSLTESLTLGGSVFVIALFAIVSVIALAKIYMGIMGFKYCKGTGKGKLHITLAKIGVALTVIAVEISVIDMINGTGAVQTIISDIADVIVIHWYLKLAEKFAV